jgi:hypothetical protein
MISEREARFRTRTLGWSCLVGVLICLAAFGTTPTFYLALLIPWIAALVYRQGKGAIHLLVGKGDPRPNVTHVYAFSTMWPGIVALFGHAHPVRWEFLWLMGALIGTLLAAVAIKDRRTWHWTELLILLAVNSFYGMGVASAIDQDLDSETPQIQTANVLTKRVGRYRRRDYYYLKLTPWGPRTLPAEVEVDSRVYDKVSVGGTVCIELHPGALRIPWFNAHTCPVVFTEK